MFNLENAIKSWKNECRKQKNFEDGIAAELESHLRDTIDGFTENGFSEEEAFNRAVKEIGDMNDISSDYGKTVSWEQGKRNTGPLLTIHLLLNTLKVSFRLFYRNKTYSLISILGLAAGLSISILIFLWGRNELNVNKVHKNLKNIHIVTSWQQYGSKRDFGMGSPPAIGPALMEELPEVEKAARFQNGKSHVLLRYKDKATSQEMQFADIECFDIFTLPIVEGDITSQPQDPDTIIISEKIRKILFGNKPAVGKIINVENKFDMKVIGVMKDMDYGSTIRFDVWTPMEFMTKFWPGARIDTWYNLAFRTYVLVTPGTKINLLKEKISGRVKQSDPTTIISPSLYPFEKLYLYFYGAIGRVFLFGIFGLVILGIACINFINLTTARSSARAKEIGIRKVTGATQLKLIKQFFTETFLIVIIAAILSLIIVETIIPQFNQYTGARISLNIFSDFQFLIALGIIVVFTGFMSGLYPALILSSIKPVKTLRGLLESGTSGNAFRKGLVISQFTVAIILIISTIIMFSQENYMKTMDVGIDRDQILSVRLQGSLLKKYTVLRDQMDSVKGVTYATIASNPPTGIYVNGHSWEWEGRDPALNPLVTYLGVDAHYRDTFNIQIVEGEFFSQEEEAKNNVLVNETFATLMNYQPATGRTLRKGETVFTIKGVVKDFNYRPAWDNIGPLIIFKDFNTRRPRYVFAKLSGDNISDTLNRLEKVVTELNPGFPFEYYFLDDMYNRIYAGMKKSSKLMIILSVLAIFISCIGLYGLSLFVMEKKTKEIGIRKAMGANISQITILLSKEFLKWLLIANCIAWPVAWVLMNIWLTNFAYRITIYPTAFITTLVITMCVAIGTLTVQTISAASANPVDSLRNE